MGAPFGIMKGFSEIKAGKEQSKAIKSETELAMKQRERKTQAQIGNQTVSYLKSGVNLTGSAKAVIEETRRLGDEDLEAMRQFGIQNMKNVEADADATAFNTFVNTGFSMVGGF